MSETADYLGKLYELEEKANGWWYRCKTCGSTAGGYSTKSVAMIMGDRHVMMPHEKKES